MARLQKRPRLLSPPHTLKGAGQTRRPWYPDEPEGRCSKPEGLAVGPGLDRETWELGLVIGGRGRAWGGGLHGPAPPRVGMTSVILGSHHALSCHCHNVPAPSRQTGTEQPRRRLCGSAASRPSWLEPCSQHAVADFEEGVRPAGSSDGREPGPPSALIGRLR